MFLNTGILKRLMKQAYKTGLIVARTENRMYLAGDYWEMDVRMDFLPKQILACIIELTGEIPEEGERYKATKDGNQQEINLRMQVDKDGYQEGIEVTKMILIGKQGTHQRILQERTGGIFIIHNVFVEIADNSALEEERGEYEVIAPLYSKTGILWMNNVARFHAYWRSDENHERILAELTQLDLTEDPVE